MDVRRCSHAWLHAARLAVGLGAGLAWLSVGCDTVAAQGWFGGLFGGGGRSQAPQSQPGFPGLDNGPAQGGDNVYVPRHRARRHVEPQAQTSRPAQHDAGLDKPAPQKKNASVFVDVLGDTMGQFLANGLDEALADRQDVEVVHRARGPTGLVNTGYFDWPKAVDAMLAGKDKIDVAVMMIGSNDRQPITQDGKTYDVGSDDWKRIYASRITAIDEAFRKKKIPLIWVGVPITKNTDFADDMAMLNDITRDAASKTGTTFIDTWEAFAGDNGEFEAYGPDIDGQTVRLRSGDGILFTHAGARKLANFVEGAIRHDLDGKAPPPVLPTGAAPEASGATAATTRQHDAKGETKPKPKPEAGPIVDLTAAPWAADGELASPAAAGGANDAEALARSGPGVPPAGRADDARWPVETSKTP